MTDDVVETVEQYLIPLMEAATEHAGRIMADECNGMFRATGAATGARAEVRDDFPGHRGWRVVLTIPVGAVDGPAAAMLQDVVVSYAIGIRVGLKLARSCEFCGLPDNRPDVDCWPCPYCGLVWNERMFRGVDRATRLGPEQL